MTCIQQALLISDLVQVSFEYYNTKQSNKSYEEYGVFYPFYVGKKMYSFHTKDYSIDAKVNKVLLPYIKKNNSLIISYLSYENEGLIYINDNYLHQSNLLDKYGNKITIDKNRREPVALVSESFHNNQPDSLQHFDKQIKQIPIKKGQNLLTYDPSFPIIHNVKLILVYPSTIDDDYIRDVTFIDGESSASPLKIKLIDNDVKKTYAQLKPILEKNELADNLLSFIRLSDAHYYKLLRVAGNLKQYAFEVIISFVLTSLLIGYVSYLYFNIHKKTIVIKKMNGYSTINTYKHFCLTVILQHVIFFLILLNTIDSKNLSSIMIIFILLELLINFFIFVYMEKSSIVKTLQGE